ncbi:MAG TPA: choice-of-anchor D domain-containing protein [Terriglobales bacterium]|nr:choice-of-anchor D domain-containing protein [Terriglobales bacterium]
MLLVLGWTLVAVLFLSPAWSASTSSSQKHGAFTAAPSSINFGNVQVGSSASQNETLTNNAQTTLTIYNVSTTGAGFSTSGLTPPVSLTPGQSYTFTVTYAPASAGAVSGTVTVGSKNWRATFDVPLSGTGTAAGQLSLSPASLNFGNVTVGSSSTLGAKLTASGASVTISSANNSNSAFALSGLTFPFTLTPGSSASFNVVFTPGATGLASGTTSFVSTASNAPTLSVSGTGISAPHSVALSWDPSTSVVSGYNVYRGTKSGGPYSRINSALDPVTAYNDGAVQSGSSYYYVTTAVDSSGVESSYSNEVKAVIPTP